MPELKWIKITTSMFDDEKIKIIESMPDGDAILTIWIKLLIQAMKTFANSEDMQQAGYVYLNPNVPYTDDMLATIFDRPVLTIRLALTTFQHLNMIEIEQDGRIYIPKFPEHQNIEQVFKLREQSRNRMRKFRAKPGQPELPITESLPVTPLLRHSYATVTQQNKNKNKSIDKEIDLIPSSLQGIENNNNGISKEEGQYPAIPYDAPKGIDISYSAFKQSLNNMDEGQAVGLLVRAFREWHGDTAPKVELDDPWGRVGALVKAANNDPGYILKLLWDSCTAAISGSHLNYIQEMIDNKKRRKKQAGVRSNLRNKSNYNEGKYQGLVER